MQGRGRSGSGSGGGGLLKGSEEVEPWHKQRSIGPSRKGRRYLISLEKEYW
jgi:hypothetical protein